MQRLDRKRHSGGARIGQYGGEAVVHLLVRAGEVLRSGRQSSHHEDQRSGA